MANGAPSVLVVDDELDTCRNLSDILTDLGYHVDTAHGGPSALELVRHKAYDMALLDLKMPGMDGLALYRAIKRLGAGSAAIIVRAYATGSTAAEARTAGAWQVLAKPVDLRTPFHPSPPRSIQSVSQFVALASIRSLLQEAGSDSCSG